MRRLVASAPMAMMLLLAGCGAASNPEVDLAAEEAALRRADEQFAAAVSAAMSSKDMATVMSHYAADAVVMMPNEAPAQGTEEIRDLYDRMLPVATSLTWSASQVMVARAADMGITRGSFQMAIQTPAGPVEDRGKYLTVWKKVDGEWKVAFDIGNTDLPAPGGH